MSRDACRVRLQVVLDTAGRGKYSYKQLMMALKEAKVAGHWLESSPDIRALLSALAVRLQEQGRDFRKVLSAMLSMIAQFNYSALTACS